MHLIEFHSGVKKKHQDIVMTISLPEIFQKKNYGTYNFGEKL